MKKLMNILMLSCKAATELIEKKLQHPLNPVEKIQLYFHTSMCDACKSYQKQSKELEDVMSKHVKINPSSSDISKATLSSGFKDKIIRDLEKK